MCGACSSLLRDYPALHADGRPGPVIFVPGGIRLVRFMSETSSESELTIQPLASSKTRKMQLQRKVFKTSIWTCSCWTEHSYGSGSTSTEAEGCQDMWSYWSKFHPTGPAQANTFCSFVCLVAVVDSVVTDHRVGCAIASFPAGPSSPSPCVFNLLFPAEKGWPISQRNFQENAAKRNSTNSINSHYLRCNISQLK